MGGSQSPGKVLALVLGIILTALGLAMVIGGILALSTYAVGLSASVGGSAVLPITGNSSVLALAPSMPIRVSITSVNAYFKVAVVPTASLPLINSTYWPSMFVGWFNLSEFRNVDFTGNYTGITMVLRPGYALLVWPYRVSMVPSLLSYSFRQLPSSGQYTTFNLGDLLFLAPPLIIGCALIIGGVILIRWSRGKDNN